MGWNHRKLWHISEHKIHPVSAQKDLRTHLFADEIFLYKGVPIGYYGTGIGGMESDC